jgi:exo-beta-1,3-glucanase (GH17 family)
VHGCWDAFNLHLYTDGQLQFGAGTNAARVFEITRAIRSRHGDGDPIWVTEYGFTTSGSSPNGAHQDRVSEAQQADGLRRLYNRLMTMSDVRAAIAYTLRDRPSPTMESSNPEYGFGVVRSDLSPKPAICHFVRRSLNTYSGC